MWSQGCLGVKSRLLQVPPVSPSPLMVSAGSCPKPLSWKQGAEKWVTDKENRLTLRIDQSILKKEKKREVGIHHKLNSHNPSCETHIKCNKTPNSLKRNCCKNWNVNDTQTCVQGRNFKSVNFLTELILEIKKKEVKCNSFWSCRVSVENFFGYCTL